MGQPSINELMERLAWSKERVNQLEAKCESWRNQALLAQAREKALATENLELRQKLEQSLPLYDPDEFVAGREE
jgi:phage shock protein A